MFPTACVAEKVASACRATPKYRSGVTIWRTERRFGSEAQPAARDEDRTPRRGHSPRDRFSTPVPISPALPPVVRPPGPPPPLPVPVVPPTGPRPRATRSRYDWRVTRHVARPVEVADDEKHYLATFGWTAAWYAVPFALFAAWTMTFPSSAGTACARPTGNACPSPRSAALTTLIHGMPRVGIALGIALIVAGLVRLGSTAWRPVTVGFSAAVIGAGMATVLYSVVNSTG